MYALKLRLIFLRLSSFEYIFFSPLKCIFTSLILSLQLSHKILHKLTLWLQHNHWYTSTLIWKLSRLVPSTLVSALTNPTMSSWDLENLLYMVAIDSKVLQIVEMVCSWKGKGNKCHRHECEYWRRRHHPEITTYAFKPYDIR